MPEISEQTQLVLAQNQHAFVQDSTKGIVQVYAGPLMLPLSRTDRPVIYDKEKDEFVPVQLNQAIKQNPFVHEGHYLVLENPVMDGEKLRQPKVGGTAPIDLLVGRKINIPGPATFPLWPGQFAQAIPGHHLRSNQYLVVRVYNADEATKNAPAYLKSEESGDKFTPGQLLVIKGTEVSFFIPPTGFEVLKENEEYVREALTLERLEYCILLDEDGNKRYEKGPAVVFPEATEKFVIKDNARKFKAIELNDQMGVYVKVIADAKDELGVKIPEGVKEGAEFKHNGTKYRVEKGAVWVLAGEELFITGKEMRIYYPRAEFALIGYDDVKQVGLKRERYYGITLPTGEARYVLDKIAGTIQKVEGPQIFVPDPRSQVIVRRVLDSKTVGLWYPSNVEALTFNESLRALNEDPSSSYLADSVVLSAAADLSRGINRGTEKSKAFAEEKVGSGVQGERFSRGTRFTPPPMLTLNSKYDGVPSISVWTGYAVQVVNKLGKRRIEVGPTTILLDYDETLEMVELSTGKPKNTDTLKRDVYLRVDNNLVSDVIRIETKDLVSMDLKVCYRVNFLPEHKNKWFNVENYVKYLCDDLRSRLKAAGKKYDVKTIMEESAIIIRDVVLGEKTITTGEKPVVPAPRHRFFPENGMDVYDVEVLTVTITDERIAKLLRDAQTRAVESAITLNSDETTLVNTRRKTVIDMEIEELTTTVKMRRQELAIEVTKAVAEATLAEITAEVDAAAARLNAEVAEQAQRDAIVASTFQRSKTASDYEMGLEKERVSLFEKKMAALAPSIVQAIQTLGDNEMVTRLSEAFAPLAIIEQTSTSVVMERVFKGTAMETVLGNIKDRSKAASAK